METPGMQAWLRRSPRPVLRWPRSAYGAIVAWMLALRRREGPRELLVADPAVMKLVPPTSRLPRRHGPPG